MSTIRDSLRDRIAIQIPISRKKLTPLLLVGPALVTVFLVTIGPMLWSLWLSFNRWTPSSLTYQEPTFSGVDNFVWLFAEGRFWNSMANFVYYGGVGVTVQVLLGTALALALYNYVDRQGVRVALLTLFAVPMMIAPLVAGRIWQLLFLPGGGAVNGILGMVGSGGLPWLQSQWIGLTALMIADTWQWVGLPLLIIYGGRASISDSLYEAARVNGASRWMQFRHITLPQLRTLIAIAFILRFMDAYKFFDKLFIMTRGGPGTQTELPTFYTYIIGFSQFNIGRAAALTWVIGLGSILTMLLFWRFMNAEGSV